MLSTVTVFQPLSRIFSASHAFLRVLDTKVPPSIMLMRSLRFVTASSFIFIGVPLPSISLLRFRQWILLLIVCTGHAPWCTHLRLPPAPAVLCTGLGVSCFHHGGRR